MDWSTFFQEVQGKDYAKRLHHFLDEEYQNNTCFPPRELIFQAFKLTPFEQIKVVIIGQDPYHQPGQAMGLAFSVPTGVTLPPSLRNIYREIQEDLGVKMKNDGDLTYLAHQGVLLLNARLSVRSGQALSHDTNEHQAFLIDVLKYIDCNPRPIVFMLWGGFARQLKVYINQPERLILESVHPSPLSANRGGWFGNHHFSQANYYLKSHNIKPIIWDNEK